MAKKIENPGIPIAVLQSYEAMVANHPGVERKGATLPYTSVNGHMTSFIHADGTVALRMSTADRAWMLETYHAPLMVAHGAVMKEFVALPAELLEDAALLHDLFGRSYAYALSMKPKPSKGE